MALTTLEQQNLIRVIARLQEDINRVKALLSGVPISTVRIADASITNAKIVSMEADKITAGDIIVGIDIGGTFSGRYIRIDGANGRIVSNDGTTNRGVFGEV